MDPRQLSLPEPENEEGRAQARGQRLDPASEALLARYAADGGRLRDSRTVRAEVSQLRSLVRLSTAGGGPRTLRALLDDLPTLTHVLTAPGRPLAASTGRRRLRAAQRALLLEVPPPEGRRRQDRLHALLPKRPTRGWHEDGVVVAGVRRRRRPRSVTIEPADLARIVEAAGRGKTAPRALRDRAVVAVHCFSGLRVREIRTLAWSQLSWESEFEGWMAAVERGDQATSLPVVGVAAPLLARLRLEAVAGAAGRFVFLKEHQAAPLTERQIRRIVQHAGAEAGFPRAHRTDLLSACAAWLQAQPHLSDREVARVLGLSDLRSVDRLLRRHKAIEWQREAWR